MTNHKNLIVWQKSMELVTAIYVATKTFPKEELFGIVLQMRRSAVSIPSNIAEGSSRTSEAEFSHFLEYSIGSCFEVETQLELAKRRGYISEDQFLCQLTFLQTEEKQLNQFISKLKRKG